jgi:hypothetical protein
MTKDKFLVYRKFDDPALAEELVDFLKDNQIPYLVEETILNFDPTFAATRETAIEFTVKINHVDFENVNQMLIEQQDASLEEIDAEHYLHKFTNDELVDVLIKADEWSATDNVLAKRLLLKRKAMPDDATLVLLKQNQLNDLKKPIKAQISWIIVGYMFSVLGILGLAIGWHLMNLKHTLPNGERLYRYDESSRQHGKLIFILSCICFSLIIILRIYLASND